MFKYDQDRDRFLPDRHQDVFGSFSSLSDQCACSTNCNESGFLEPFQCERQLERQNRAFQQLRSYMSLQSNGGHLLQSAADAVRENEWPSHDYAASYLQDSDVAWPIRMARRRISARTSNNSVNKKTLDANLVLDMPNLTDDRSSQVLDWSSTGYLTVAIESSIHLWSGRTQSVLCTIDVAVTSAAAAAADGSAGASAARSLGGTSVGCLKWDARGEKLAYSFAADYGGGGDGGGATSTTSTSTTDTSTWTAGNDRPAATATTGVIAGEDGETELSTSDEFDGPVWSNKRYRCYRVKVWLFGGLNDGSNYEQHATCCGCVTNNVNQYQFSTCSVTVMNWLADDCVLVTGCTKGTITFFRYGFQQKRLITTRIIHNRNTSISCLHVSQDQFSRHLAAATYTQLECVLKVWRLEDSSCERIKFTEVLVDRYTNKHYNRLKWMINAFAWHPWKYSLMCYAVGLTAKGLFSLDGPMPKTWFVLANASKGQVLKRVPQIACNSFCSMAKTLFINIHLMTFSRLTGELLVSVTNVYSVQKNSSSSIVEKHSVVVMHALDRIVETLSSSQTDRGLFFAWNPDGTRIALTSSDESLRIWNFWPTTTVPRKFDCSPHVPRHSGAACPNTSVHLTDNEDLNNSREGRKLYCHSGNRTQMSELSLDASRVIK